MRLIKLCMIALISSFTFALVSCKSNDIPYKIASNYYVRNNVGDSIPTKIEDDVIFHSYFGMAAVMGKNGMPTEIDFSKQYVIAVTLPATDIDTEINPIKLTRENGNEITYTYEVQEKGKYSFTMRPFSLIIVDKKYDGTINLVKK